MDTPPRTNRHRPTRVMAVSLTMLCGCLCGTALWATPVMAGAEPLPDTPAPARSSSAAGPSGSRWVATALGVVGGQVVVSDINDRGQVVGHLTTGHGRRGFVWKSGSMKELGKGGFASAGRINERGQIIGTAGGSAAHRAEHAVLWKNWKMRDLGFTFVTAINERGQILGARFVSLGGGAYGGAPVIWASGKVRDLFGLAGRGGQASDINNRGQVVGTTRNGRALLWQNGKVADLGPGTAVAINGRGQIIGYETTLAGKSRAFFWQNGTRTDLGPGAPVAINRRGQVIGYRQTSAGEFRAVLWERGTTATRLGTLGGASSFPTAISDRGQVVGYSSDRSGVQHAFVWQNGTMTGLPSPMGSARTRATAINEHNQIVGDNCYQDCGYRSGPLSGSKFGVLWTLHGVAHNGRWVAYSTAPAAHSTAAAGDRRRDFGASGSDVFVIRVGGHPKLVAGRHKGEIENACPAFSPNGRMLAFGRNAPGGSTIVVVGVAGDGTTDARKAVLKVRDRWAPARCPRWSSDSTRLAYLDGNGRIVVRGLDGSRRHRVQGDPRIRDFDRNKPVLLSPTGDLIARRGAAFTIVVSRPNLSDRRVINDDPPSYAIAGWSPDGRKLLLMRDVGGGFTMRAVSVEAPFASTTVVGYASVNTARSWPGYGDVSWQPIPRR